MENPKPKPKPRWYEQVRNDILERDERCKLEGINYVASLASNPFSYRSFEAYKEAHKPKNFGHKKCQLRLRDRLSKKTDRLGRFYNKDIRYEQECKNIQGVWDRNAINRSNKYGKGVCWTSKEQAECGAKTSIDLIIPDKKRELGEKLESEISMNKKVCEQTDLCKWNSEIDECIKAEAEAKAKTVSKPPPGMPKDITSEEAQIQNYLHEWYTNGTAPATDKLIGTGNRCGGPSDPEPESVKSLEFDTEHLYTKEELKTIKFPLRGSMRTIMRNAIGSPNVDVLSWLHAQKKEAEIADLWDKVDLYIGIDDLEDYVNHYEYFYGLKPVTPVTEYLPSVSQSVINMLMKTMVNRGIMAWHSTGSGKCHAKNTPILMFDGSIKMVQDVRLNDVLMGDDSTPRKVLSLASGYDEMFDIIPARANADKYTVNSVHILCLKQKVKQQTVSKLMKPYRVSHLVRKKGHNNIRVRTQHFSQQLLADMYVESIQDEVFEIEVQDFLQLTPRVQKKLQGYQTHIDFPHVDVDQDPYTVGKMAHTHIPDMYKINDRQTRLSLFQGILEGRVGNPTLAKDVLFLTRSLGINAYITESGKVVTVNNDLTMDLSVQHVGKGKYYGFTLDGNNRYVLGDFTVTHNTCTATGVMEAVWDSGKQIIFASSIDAIASNPPFKFHECASRLFPRFKGKQMEDIASEFLTRGISFKTFAVLSNNVKKVEKLKKSLGIKPGSIVPVTSKKRITGSKYNQVLETIAASWNVDKKRIDAANTANKKDRSYVADLSEFMDLDNAVLIIDEVHNLFRPLSHQREQHQFLEKHLVDPTLHPKLKIVILTATPGDNVPDVMKLLNIIRDPTHPVIQPVKANDVSDIYRFKKEIRGMVSFFDMSNDRTKFPVVMDQGPIKYPMSTKQFSQYLEKYKEVSAEMKDYDKLAKGNKLSKFWQGARKYSNMLFSFNKTMQLTEFSSKLPALIEKIKSFPLEKQYCYSAFYTNQGSGHGILEIARQLVANGYTKLTIAEAKASNKSGVVLPKGKRFILAIQSEIGEGGGKNLHEMMQIYNSEENKHGELVHVFLASQSFNEGLDLKAVRHIHIFEPLVTMASDLQTIGRARRFCSHAHLPQSQWTVQIHRYFSDFPIDIQVSSGLDMQLNDLQGIIDDLNNKIKIETNKLIKKALKDKLAAKKKELTSLKKDIKEKEKMNADNIHNIDEFIYKKAQEKMKELFVTFHCLKESAVDCMLLKEFHNDSTIQCIDQVLLQNSFINRMNKKADP